MFFHWTREGNESNAPILVADNRNTKRQIPIITTTNRSKVDFKKNTEIKAILESLKLGMTEYIEPGETAYTESDVETCMLLMNNFLSEISKSASKEKAMQKVKKIVFELNDLNQKCEYELIETDQREQLAAIIILAGNLKNFNERNEDITEEWRAW